ncbi:lipoate--protein ligase [Clostridium sp. HV4-5-A1G]|uniref:lipoate--protein ligase n=1 Tax=Clostridium sp. HV4-5-A1G TaxID=2004595 RepID=UPI00123A5D4D|nr:lipoate--protein ligase [Clostridium sp. HV4-5-A1G]KAA8679083.1 lipoate--protein ligase [Clostridium sp. HV4-5-A1G]
MRYIETNSTNATYNFACEVFCMKRFKNDKTMLIWQADNCVMLGRYQTAQTEVNFDAVKKIKADVIRRNTGGGTIYTDLGTLLYTFIMPVNNFEDIDFSTTCRPIVYSLNKMGIKAELKGRNDILVGAKKISGNAQTVEGNVLCSHGSLLYNSNLDLIQDLLIVDKAKIKSKGIASVRSRMTNIIEYMPVRYSLYEFWQRLKEYLSEKEVMTEYRLSAEDIMEIERIRDEKFATWEWNMGNAPKFNYSNELRFPNGKVSVKLDINSGVVERCKINGDFLGLMPIEALEKIITGTKYSYEDMKMKLNNVNFDIYFRGISKDQFLKCIFS